MISEVDYHFQSNNHSLSGNFNFSWEKCIN